MNFTTTDGASVPINIRRRKGTKHLRLSIGQKNQVIASVPWHTSDHTVANFIDDKSEWMEEQISSAPRVYTLMQWLTQEPHLTASGDIFDVRVEPSNRRVADYVYDQGGAVLVLRLPRVEEYYLRALVGRFAKDSLGSRVAYQSKRLGLKHESLSVRDQCSRWGSCSARGGISLNWRLVLLSPPLQDYIILHELAHLSEMNHSVRFWTLLDHYDPLRVLHEAELDQISAQLMRVGRS
ncbi:MAG: SprT family zinc-dependent metalloprotease [Verrucomicrobiota bacterium]|nr:SprT family zinc-dependent metalloprotease [Verrucomicrobiota bacterium]